MNFTLSNDFSRHIAWSSEGGKEETTFTVRGLVSALFDFLYRRQLLLDFEN